MSSILTREGRRQRRRRNQANVGPIDVEQYQGEGACIDLTDDTGSDDTPVVIDLTTPMRVNESPIVIIESIDRNEGSRRRRLTRSGSRDDVEELPRLPFKLSYDSPPSSSSGPSPKRSAISCPVCLDETHVITRSGRQLMSTVCGHIFCAPCIEAAIQAQKKCPSCRKKLLMKQIHPIFI